MYVCIVPSIIEAQLQQFRSQQLYYKLPFFGIMAETQVEISL